MKNRWIFLLTLLSSLLAHPSLGRCQDDVNRGLFVSVIQNPPVLSSREEILRLIRFAQEAKIRTLFIQIYRAGKAWFPSRVGDSEPYEICRKQAGEDPFALLIREAHRAGLEVHAWLNLLSLSQNEQAPILKKYGPAILTRNTAEKKTLQDYQIDNQYFLEPGDPRVQKEMGAMVEEILRAYPALDGIQLDYIRYPDMHPFYGYTPVNIERFKKATGIDTINDYDPVWQDWKRTQVTGLVEKLAGRARKIRPALQVSTTGCAPYTRALYEAFQDWPSWLKRGLVDFVTVMTYPPDAETFEKYVAEVKSKTGESFERINIGIGAYKLETSPQVFAQQFKDCEESQSRACVVFHYENLVDQPLLAQALAPAHKVK